MLRNNDYELAVELGVIDEDTANKYKCTDDVCCSGETLNSEFDEVSKYKSKIYKLQDVIIYLSKELLKKEETIQNLQENFDRLYHDKNEISGYLHQAKQELSLLERMIDKLAGVKR